MIHDVGKNIVSLRMHDQIISMFNASIMFNEKINFYEEDGTTIRYTLTVDETGKGGRALQYTRSLPGDNIDLERRPVIYIPENVDAGEEGATCIPLYECIAPSLARRVEGTYHLTWWTNTDQELETDDGDMYVYDYSKIKKFYTASLGDIEETASSAKLLCTAPIHWEMLKQETVDTKPYNTPIIKDITVLACITGEGYIVDFSTGGNGGGNKIHSHLSTQDCGFAGAVFMPSAVPRVMSWM